jgi:hypothetical protein
LLVWQGNAVSNRSSQEDHAPDPGTKFSSVGRTNDKSSNSVEKSLLAVKYAVPRRCRASRRRCSYDIETLPSCERLFRHPEVGDLPMQQ